MNDRIKDSVVEERQNYLQLRESVIAYTVVFWMEVRINYSDVGE